MKNEKRALALTIWAAVHKPHKYDKTLLPYENCFQNTILHSNLPNLKQTTKIHSND